MPVRLVGSVSTSLRLLTSAPSGWHAAQKALRFTIYNHAFYAARFVTTRAQHTDGVGVHCYALFTVYIRDTKRVRASTRRDFYTRTFRACRARLLLLPHATFSLHCVRSAVRARTRTPPSTLRRCVTHRLRARGDISCASPTRNDARRTTRFLPSALYADVRHHSQPTRLYLTFTLTPPHYSPLVLLYYPSTVIPPITNDRRFTTNTFWFVIWLR